MPLWMSSGDGCGGGVWFGLADQLVDLAGDVALEAAQGLTAGLALGDAPGEVGAGLWVPAQARQRDAVQRGVGLPVAAAVEAQTDGLRMSTRSGPTVLVRSGPTPGVYPGQRSHAGWPTGTGQVRRSPHR